MQKLSLLTYVSDNGVIAKSHQDHSAGVGDRSDYRGYVVTSP